MSDQVGRSILRVLEDAGARYLDPETLRIFLLQIGGGPSLHVYDGRSGYWRHVQMVLDVFFSAAERADVCAMILAEVDLDPRPEAWDFLASALAERQLQVMLGAPYRAAAGSP